MPHKTTAQYYYYYYYYYYARPRRIPKQYGRMGPRK